MRPLPYLSATKKSPFFRMARSLLSKVLVIFDGLNQTHRHDRVRLGNRQVKVEHSDVHEPVAGILVLERKK